MGRTYEAMTKQVAAWIERQHMFFVATAPLDGDGHVNVSPKGLDTMRLLDERTVAYLDLTGSGAETAAHLRENGRITIMWCAFDGPPRIVRVHGRGEYVALGDERVAGRFADDRGARGIVIVHAYRISDSCGYSVPLYEFQAHRTRLTEWTDHQTDEELDAYRARHNTTSIDGLPALAPVVGAD